MTNIWNWKDILQSGTLRYLNGYKNQSVCCRSLSDLSSCPVSCVGLLTSFQNSYCSLPPIYNPKYVTISHLRVVSLTSSLDLVAICLMETLSKYYKTFLRQIWKMDFWIHLVLVNADSRWFLLDMCWIRLCIRSRVFV